MLLIGLELVWNSLTHDLHIGGWNMVDKKVIILSTVAIILMIILVFICFGSNLSVFKQETDLVITSNSTLNNGDNFTVKTGG